jgi:hypothetical protein
MTTADVQDRDAAQAVLPRRHSSPPAREDMGRRGPHEALLSNGHKLSGAKCAAPLEISSLTRRGTDAFG